MCPWFDNLSADEQRAALDRLTSPAGRAALDYAGPDAPREFAAWLAEADRLSLTQYGLSIFDLSDFGWRDHYADELTPADALAAAIEYSGS
jgi:hypothetical protein